VQRAGAVQVGVNPTHEQTRKTYDDRLEALEAKIRDKTKH
jgi:hypothetical protein